MPVVSHIQGQSAINLTTGKHTWKINTADVLHGRLLNVNLANVLLVS